MSQEIDDALWEDFHTVVNMTSRELRDWLATAAAGEHTRSSRSTASVKEVGHERRAG